jgi:hypothetical protein
LKKERTKKSNNQLLNFAKYDMLHIEEYNILIERKLNIIYPIICISINNLLKFKKKIRDWNIHFHLQYKINPIFIKGNLIYTSNIYKDKSI